ncbi:MAG: hypothetical protein ACHQ4G_09620 [Opitutales bacterium]
MNPFAANSVARHSLAWLLAANLVGLLLAALQRWPGLNEALAPLTYGRWVPLHLDWQLYGWCSLPLVGALLAWLSDPADPAAASQARWALRGWSLALALGGVSWLAGATSGKLFLDWSGWARPVLPLAMAGLWGVLALAVWRRRPGLGRGALGARVALLTGLLAVPILLFQAASREVYPSVNPDSGGATGTSLLASTLVIVAIGGLLPVLLGVARRPERPARGAWFWLAWLGAVAVCAMLGRGDVSHHAWSQILGLGTLLLWAPLGWIHYRSFAWPAAAGRWLAATGVWWVLLLLTGWLVFLPGALERAKFTDLLVAHSHLAMAGFVTSLNGVVLAALGRAPGGGRTAFAAWQIGAGAMLAILVGLGWGEIVRPADYFLGAPWIDFCLDARLAAGGLMTIASAAWMRRVEA